jgi:glycosyltransferase involved in cell wall biosynthesis
MAGNHGSKITIIALGLRGLPNVPGGVEAHAAELYPRLQKLGIKVTVLGRSAYQPANAPPTWQGVSVHWLPSPRIQGVEALVHTFVGVLYAAVHRPDVLHIHAVGPWLMVPLAKLLGLNVVVTHHGQDYLREKWNAPAKSLLRLGERLGMRFADERVVISNALLELARVKYGRKATLIPNGVSNPQPRESLHLLEKYGLASQRYVIQVSRLVPEKRQLDLITAFNAAHLCGWKLLLVGGAQGSQRYADLVHQHIAGNESIINTGFLSPPEVQELLTHAGIFVLPSSHEGLPISLLEAMKLGTPVVASDIPANREIRLEECDYFPVGDTAALQESLCRLAAATAEERAQISRRLIGLCEYYDWDAIAASTMKVMERLARRRSPVLWDGTTPASPQ